MLQHKKDIGRRLAKIRRKTGESQIRFCKSLDISQGQLSNLESGKSELTETTLLLLSDIVIENKRINFDWLLTGNGEMLILGGSAKEDNIHEITAKIVSLEENKRALVIKLIDIL